MMEFSSLAVASQCLVSAANTTYTNPILPGWHSDPSCVFVQEWGDTTFCTSSTFILFPGLPIYASRDLLNWKLVSHALNRPEQLPEMATSGAGQQQGIWAPTFRFRNGTFFIAAPYVLYPTWKQQIFILTTTDPYNSSAWSDPIFVDNPTNAIDPDIFFDDDGTVYVTIASDIIKQSTFDLVTGATSQPIDLWTGTGGRNPEGPHLFKKDGFYYLLISEGGTEVNHTVTIARSTKASGPFESYEGNPILTNRDTNEYFQTVGHADLFQDASGNWWGVALSTRSGPEWKIYPMGRETVLYPATWDKGEWPILQPVRGRMSGWHIPVQTKDLPGSGPFVDDPDIFDFAPGSSIPPNLRFWRVPKMGLFTVSPDGHPNALRLTPSKANLTAAANFDALDGLTFIARTQLHTLFEYSIDVSFQPVAKGEEVGVTVFLTQQQHIDLGLVFLPSLNGTLEVHVRFSTTAFGKPNIIVPETMVKQMPRSWLKMPIRLQVSAKNETHYQFSAVPASKPDKTKVFGYAGAYIVSGGSGPFTGTLIGAYATSNGGDTRTPSYLSRWRYIPVAQAIGNGEFVPPRSH